MHLAAIPAAALVLWFGLLRGAEHRRAFLERYCDTDTLICTAHFPLPSAGRIVAEGDAFRFVFDQAT